MAAALAKEAAALGLEPAIVREPDAGGRLLPLVELATKSLSEAPLLVLGHIDTVLPASPPRRDGSILHATGAMDMKGGIVAAFGALELLASRGAAPRDL